MDLAENVDYPDQRASRSNRSTFNINGFRIQEISAASGSYVDKLTVDVHPARILSHVVPFPTTSRPTIGLLLDDRVAVAAVRLRDRGLGVDISCEGDADVRGLVIGTKPGQEYSFRVDWAPRTLDEGAPRRGRGQPQ